MRACALTILRMPEKDSFRVAVGDDAVTAIRYAARAPKAVLVLAHGAGAPQSHPFLVRFARGFASRGVATYTFDFLYTEHGRKLPDRNAALEATWSAVLDAVRARRDGKRAPLFIGGKSMGGRIASQIAAGDACDGLAGLVLLGYPLHPPGKPEKLRSAHLPRVRAPMLFCQGERDAFGTPGELAPIVRRLAKGSAIVTVAGGDHSFKVPARSGRTPEAAYDAVLDAAVRWIAGVPAAK